MGTLEEFSTAAQSFDQGVLSARLTSILSRGRGAVLSDEDRARIEDARQLILDVLGGAQTIASDSTGTSRATARSIKTLGVALNPLERLQASFGHGAISDQSIVDLLSDMAAMLESISGAEVLPEPTTAMRTTVCFFEFLSDAILASLNRSQMLPPPARF
jgi:hypothetical protein